MACIGKKMKIEFVRTDNWEVFLIDGKRIMANHSIDVEDVLLAIGVDFTDKYIDDKDEFFNYLKSIEAV